MDNQEINMKISKLVRDVQDAITDSDTNVFDDNYINDVNRRIEETETALLSLKHELTKHDLNDW